MVAISFNYRAFSDMILRGDKDQTIRPYNPERYEQIKRIGKLQLYWKQRTKECFKIADAEVTDIFRIKFYIDDSGTAEILALKDNQIDDNYYPLSPIEIQEIVSRDGFINFWDLWDALVETYGAIENREFMVIRFKTIMEVIQ